MREPILPRRAFSVAAGALLSTAWPGDLRAATPPSRPFLVTGSGSGIGRAAAVELAGNGRFVLCAARTAAAAQEVADAQGTASLAGFGLALSVGLEQSDLSSVRDYVERLDRDLPAGIEGVILNAGVEALPLRRTAQNLEATFAVNTLSHFVLAVELAARAVQERRALRVVSVTSSAAFDTRLGGGDALDLNWETRAYNARQAYVDSKACNVLLADELQRRLYAVSPSSPNLLSCSADPGPTASMLLRNALPQRAAQRATMNDEQLARQARQLGLRTPAQAARGLVWCATSPAARGGGLYLGAAAPWTRHLRCRCGIRHCYGGTKGWQLPYGRNALG